MVDLEMNSPVKQSPRKESDPQWNLNIRITRKGEGRVCHPLLCELYELNDLRTETKETR